jgi:DNA (cytosine-5)-methyltransferase 1
MRNDPVTGNTLNVLSDHICRGFDLLNEERIRRIPLEPGSDWRDLPNIAVRLKDGTLTEKLVYSYKLKNENKLTGVCSCQKSGGGLSNVRNRRPCDPADRQNNTLVPWSLCHTADRHNHWAGNYGRLQWNGYFSTTTAKPDPKAMQVSLTATRLRTLLFFLI